MIGPILAALIAANDPAASQQTPAPEAQKSPIIEAQDNLERAEQLYLQSCGDRAYGAYDDLCEQLSIQIRQDRVDLDKLKRDADRTPPTKPKS